MRIDEWVNSVINGIGGFNSWEEHEIVIHNSREESIAGFVIRCLANPACEGSKEIIEAIISERAKMINAPEAWPSKTPA
jgi:hypothetical protein